MALALFLVVPQARGADFGVAAPGFFFTFTNLSGTIPGQNPTLTLVRGETYTFRVDTGSFHPFRINSTGAVNNPTSSGTITWTVPQVESNYTYQCTVHSFMVGSIITVPVRVAKLSIGSNVVLRTTAPSNYSMFPEFKTNVTSSTWLPLTVQSNRFLLGTNETICGRPPGSNLVIRVRAQRN